MKNPFVALALLAFVFTGCAAEEAPSDANSPAGSGTGKTVANADGASGAADQPADQPTTKPSEAATTKPADTTVPDTARLDPTTYDHFGDGVAAKGETIDIAALVSKAKELDGKPVRLTGDIKSVCQKKGCWMVLSEGDHDVRIKFRDYGFFMPIDAKGRTAVLEGKFSVTETSVAELKHLLEDAGKPEEAAKVTEPKVEMKVMADGVALKK